MYTHYSTHTNINTKIKIIEHIILNINIIIYYIYDLYDRYHYNRLTYLT